MSIVETREITVKDGQVLTIEMTQRFIDHLRQHFGLLESQCLDDAHVRAYVLESVNNAVMNAERELNDKAIDPAAGGVRQSHH